MTILIIEDNEIEMENLKILLEGFPDFRLVGVADSLFNGIDIANGLQPDIIMLDIQLECENSLDHLHQLKYAPYLICSTLYSKHALQAFEVGATDYLTKPITREKLARALNRIPMGHKPSLQDRGKESLLLKNGSKTERVPIELIVLITSERDYSTVRDEKNSIFISPRRMREWKEILPPHLFIHLDRSTIVNKEQVVSYTRQGFGRSAMITFINGETHQIGSTALQRLRSVLKAEVKSEV